MMTSGDLTPLNLCMRVRGGSDDEDATSNGDSTEDEVEDEEETNRKYWEKYADEWDERCERDGDDYASMDYTYHFLPVGADPENGFPPWDPTGELGNADDIRARIMAWKSGDWRPDESDDDDSEDDADDDEEVEVEALAADYYEPEPEVDNYESTLTWSNDDELWLTERKEQLNRAAYYLRQALQHIDCDCIGEGSSLVSQEHRVKVLDDDAGLQIIDEDMVKETYAIQGELQQDWDYIDFERLMSMYGRLHFDIYSLAYNDSDAKADADLFNIEWTGGPYA
jgi:hypothetical protein